jgi:hypothetical protein
MPKTSVLYALSTDQVIYAAERMREEYGWEPVYWLVYSRARAKIEGLFPGVPLHDHDQAIKGIPHPDFASCATSAADMEFLQQHSAEVLLAAYMLERNDSTARDMDLKLRLEFVYGLVAYWNGVLESVRPDLVVFQEIPHQATNYILYQMTKHRGIRALVPLRAFPGWGFMQSTGFEVGPILKPEIAGAEEPLPEYLTDFLRMSEDGYAATKRLMLWNQLAPQGRLARLRLPVKYVARRLAAIPTYLRNLRRFETDQKQKGRSLQESSESYPAFLKKKFTTIRAKSRNRSFYERAATPFKSGSPYVYLALSSQPEMSTSPSGNEFVHQLLAVRLLSNALPEGWRLLVKEHPSQFNANHSRYAETFRNKSYYQSILQFHNTELVPMATDPFEIMDNAQAVVSVGGSTAFQALVRGRRGLLFGHAWYVDCPGLSRIATMGDITRALEAPPVDPVANRQAIERFLSTLARSIYRAPTGVTDAPLFDNKRMLSEYYRSYAEYHERFLATETSTEGQPSGG